MILIAPDKFKGTFQAAEIARLIGRRVSALHPGSEIKLFPMADGGEGTAGTLAERLRLERKEQAGSGPLGNPCTYEYFTDGEQAAIDSAAVVGRAALETGAPLHPFEATSFGLGRLTGSLLDSGIKRIYIGIGGTMTTDGGAGFLQGLGYRFFDSLGKELPALNPGLLPQVAAVEPPCRSFGEITALADVDVPLTASPDSLSALSFAPQKGVEQSLLSRLSRALEHFREVTAPLSSTPSFNGAGGGLGYAVSLLPGAKILPGATTLLGDTVRQLRPDMIYTGEGCFDSQSFGGKVTGTIISQAVPLGIPVTVVCGRCEISPSVLPEGVSTLLLSDLLHS